MKFRKLKADEIDCRPATITEKGLSLLLYKDARVDMNLLDESNVKWKRTHELIGDRLYCTVSIYDSELGEWVSRQDVGTESYTEAEKGQASDSFKRACFNWGIGRELYSAPFIWINAKDAGVYQNSKGKWDCREKFYVYLIDYDEGGNISDLIIKKRKSEDAVFSMRSEGNSKKLQETILSELKRTGVGYNNFMRAYKVDYLEDLTTEQMQEAIAKFRTMPDKPTEEVK